MLRAIATRRYHIATIFALHWQEFVERYTKWIRPVVFENVRKILSCRTAVLGCHIYRCCNCGHVELVYHSCKSRFCPTCGKHATDVWCNQVLNNLLDVAYHHLVLTMPWQLRMLILLNRQYGLNLLARSALKQPSVIDSEKQSTPRWAERQTNYTERNPLLCPFCKTELTFIGTVFGNWNELQFIFQHYGKDPSIPSYLLKPG